MFAAVRRTLGRIKTGAKSLILGTDGSIYTEDENGIRPSVRSAKSIDIQTERTAVTQTIGRDLYIFNPIGQIALGARNTVNSITSGSVTIGFNNTVLEASTVAGVAIGNSCTAGVGGVAVGMSCTHNGSGGAALGRNCSLSGSVGLAVGFQVTGAALLLCGDTITESTIGKVGFSVAGTNGALMGFLEGNMTTTTADATELNCYTYFSSPMCPLAAKRCVAFKGLIVAFSTGYKAKSWEVSGLIRRDASNNTVIVGTPTIMELAADTEAATWAVSSITADDTNERLLITVTGQAATTIKWEACLTYAQTGHA